MKSVLLLSLFFGFCTIVQAQQSLKETMGFYNGRENTISEFEALSGFDLDGLTYSGSGMQGANRVSGSKGYAGASERPHVYLTSSQTFIMKGLTPSAPCSTVNTTVSFGTAMTSFSTDNLVLFVSYSTDGGATWASPTSFTATTTWALKSLSVPGNTNAIRFQSANISFFQEFIGIDDVTVSNTGAGCTLPVRLRTFGAQDGQSGVQLNWTTEMESGNSHFLIERSTDAKAFEAVGRVEGLRNSSELHTYTYLDQSANPGINYYRLKQVDLSGAFAYSAIVAVRFEGLGIFIAYPNPTTAALTLALPKGVDAKTIQLYSSTGQLLASWSPGQPVSLSSIASGRYLLHVRTTEGRLFTQWIVKAD